MVIVTQVMVRIQNASKSTYRRAATESIRERVKENNFRFSLPDPETRSQQTVCFLRRVNDTSGCSRHVFTGWDGSYPGGQ